MGTNMKATNNWTYNLFYLQDASCNSYVMETFEARLDDFFGVI